MIAIKDMEIPSDCYDCPFAKNKRTNDYGSFCECGILEDYETINLYEHSKHPNCPLVEIEEHKVGKWIYKKLGVRTFGIVCSSCNRVYYEGQNIGSLEEFKSDIGRIMRERNVTLDEYCCHCGAEMVGVENGTTNN